MSQKTLERLEHLQNNCSDSWRAVCAERCKHLFGGEGLVLLSNQDPASYPTLSPLATEEGTAFVRTPCPSVSARVQGQHFYDVLAQGVSVEM